MKKNAFTLVELLGTIVIFAIIIGITTIGFVKIKQSYALTYYKSLELAILSAGSEYFAYNSTDNSQVSLDYLIANKYLSEEIKSCNLEKSYVSYEIVSNKKEYKVCLICSDYTSTTCLN